MLTPLRVADAEEMVDVLADDALYAFTGGSAPALDVLRKRYEAQIRGAAESSETWFNWIIRRASDGTAQGYVQATVAEDRADVAWVVGVEHQGTRVATEAAQAMCRWLVDGGVVRLTAHIHAEHVASRRVAAALGLTATSTFDDEGEELWTNGAAFE